MDSVPNIPGREGVYGHGQNLRHFADVVLYGARPDFVPSQGVNIVKLISALYQSAATGREVLL